MSSALVVVFHSTSGVASCTSWRKRSPAGPGGVASRHISVMRGLERIVRGEIVETVDAGASTASESAHLMLWTRRGRQFGELDVLSQCLAVTETMAHLDVLMLAGRLRRSEVDGVRHYVRA